MFSFIRALWAPLLVALALSACSAASGPRYSVYTLRPINGQPTYQVACHGVFDSRAVCEKRAQTVCGDQNVRTLERVSELGRMLKGVEDARIVTFQCGTPVAAAPPPPPVRQLPPAPPPAPEVPPAITGTVHFDTGKSTLTPAARVELNRVAQQARQAQPSGVMQRAQIDGHTDSTGSEAINSPLGVNRARSAWQYLRQQGISAQQFDVQGHSDADPVESNQTAHGRTQNRRAQIELVP